MLACLFLSPKRLFRCSLGVYFSLTQILASIYSHSQPRLDKTNLLLKPLRHIIAISFSDKCMCRDVLTRRKVCRLCNLLSSNMAQTIFAFVHLFVFFNDAYLFFSFITCVLPVTSQLVVYFPLTLSLSLSLLHALFNSYSYLLITKYLLELSVH